MSGSLDRLVHQPESCPLCGGRKLSRHHQYQQRFRDQLFSRVYWRCGDCELVFLQSDLQVPTEFEVERYREHENDISDPGYRQFLQQLWQPLRERVSREGLGLDFGSGPAPALIHLAEEDGYRMQAYDPYFQKDEGVLSKRFDYLVSSEVVEHFCEPKPSWDQLVSLVRPGGLIAIMTDRVPTEKAFKDWPYIRDLTHVCFYSEKTFCWLAEHYGFEVEFVNDRVVFLEL